MAGVECYEDEDEVLVEILVMYSLATNVEGSSEDFALRLTSLQLYSHLKSDQQGLP